jgi:hypothetical protein
MKKMFTLAAAMALPLLAASAQAACTLEAAPQIPDGKTATLDQMKATQAAVKAYGNDYRACLDAEAAAANAAAPKDEKAEAKNARAAVTAEAYNASIDKQTALAASFNDAVKAYKAAQAK